MEQFLVLIGKKGIIAIIGLLFFIFSYTNSVKIFDWIENQTYGTRDYLLQRFEILMMEVNPEKLKYFLLIISFGNAVLIFGIFAVFGHFLPAIFLSVMFGFIGWKLPKPFVDYLVEKRIKEYQSQMVDALNLLSNGLRAGLSLPQAFGLVVDELKPPISEEFRYVLQQNKLGMPFEECLETLNKRMPLEDNEMFVTSVSILRETGGNLPEVFDTITDVIRERVRLQQKIDTYIASGKVQAMIISAMPTVMFLLSGGADPARALEMVTNPIGIIMIMIALALNIGGFFVIMKVVRIKV